MTIEEVILFPTYPHFPCSGIVLAMSWSAKLLTACGFVLILVSLSASDWHLTKNVIVLPSSESSSTGTLEPGADVLAILKKNNYETQTSREENILSSIVPENIPVVAHVLLLNGDRVGFIAFADSPDVKSYFNALKSALQKAFSKDLKELRDEKERREGKPTRDILTFRDPAIHSERLVFIKVRTRIYEVHVTDGNEVSMNALLEELTD